MRHHPRAIGVLMAICVAGACGSPEPAGAPIVVDGSSTVFPISEAVAGDYLAKHPAQAIAVSSSSTGVGLRRFCAGELDIADASRHITSDEAAACAAAGVQYVELPIAYDAITIVVNQANTWAESISVAELKRLWQPAAEGRVTRWSQVSDGWPDREIHLAGPDGESGTFDYFNEVVSGGPKESRTDYTGHVDDNRIVEAVERDELALGYVGFTSFERQEDRLKGLPVDDLDERIGPGSIAPTLTNVRRGVYRPLSRPLFLYVRATSLHRPEVRQFVEYYARFAPEIVDRVGGVRLTRWNRSSPSPA